MRKQSTMGRGCHGAIVWIWQRSGGWHMRTDELSIQKSQLGIHAGCGPASATRSADSQRYALREHNVEDTIVHRVPPDPGGDRTFNLLFVLGTSYLVSGGRLKRNDVLGWNSPCLDIASGYTFRCPTRRFNGDENVAAVLRRRHWCNCTQAQPRNSRADTFSVAVPSSVPSLFRLSSPGNRCALPSYRLPTRSHASTGATNDESH